MTPPLRRVLAAWLAISAGRWIFMVATGVFAFNASGATSTSAVTVARLLPAMLAAPLSGVLIDRISRTLVVTLSCASQAVAITTAAVVASSGRSLLLLVAAMVVASAAGTPCRPALQAVLPALARSPDELTRATAVWSATDSVSFLTGAGLGGLAIAFAGADTMMIVAAGLLAASVLMCAQLPSVGATATDDEESADSSVLGGLRAIRESPLLHAPISVFVGLLLLDGASDVQVTALAIGRLHLGRGGPGVLYALWGVGGLLGSGVLVVIVRRRGYGLAVFVGAVTFALLLSVCGIGGTTLAIGAMIPVGIGFSLVEHAVMGMIPRLVDDAVVGRVYGVTELLYSGVAAVGAAVAPALMALFGVGGSLLAVGSAFFVTMLLTWRACRGLDRCERIAGRVRTLLRAVPFLAELPLPRLERLVRAARPVTASAGTTLIRAGDPGDEVFVIDVNEVEIIEFGLRQGSGEAFDGIALLHNVPSTATVRAVRDTTLWSINRPSFLAAIRAHFEISGTANVALEEHLARPLVDSWDASQEATRTRSRPVPVEQSHVDAEASVSRLKHL